MPRSWCVGSRGLLQTKVGEPNTGVSDPVRAANDGADFYPRELGRGNHLASRRSRGVGLLSPHHDRRSPNSQFHVLASANVFRAIDYSTGVPGSRLDRGSNASFSALPI